MQGKHIVGTYFSLCSTTRLVFVRQTVIKYQNVTNGQIQDVLLSIAKNMSLQVGRIEF